jgi:hypothetical protein
MPAKVPAEMPATLGGSQSDVAYLNAEDIDWQNHTSGRELTQICLLHFIPDVLEFTR